MTNRNLHAFCTTACLLVASMACLYPARASAQVEAAREQKDVVDQMMALQEQLAETRTSMRPRDFKSESEPPPDDAPPAALVAFWDDYHGMAMPSPAVRLRLLEAMGQDPSRQTLLKFFDNDAAIVERVHAFYERQVKAGTAAEFKRMRWWLALHGPWYRDELEAAARAVRYVKDRYFEHDDALRALARLDPPRAATILARLSAKPEVHLRSLVLAVQYGMESEDTPDHVRVRKELQAIARNHNAPPLARETAIAALFATGWEGREAFFDQLARDPQLVQMIEGGSGYSPLATVVWNDPEHWIPHVTTLVGNRNRAVHDNAVACLVQFHLENTREDALRPLLPWLADPSWSGAPDRLRLIQSLERTDLKESVPGLLTVIERETGFERAGAADALAKFRDPRAIPLLRAAFARETDEDNRSDLLRSLIANGGLDPAWAAHAIEQWASQPPAERKYVMFFDRLRTPEVSAGGWLARYDEVPEPVAAAVIARAEELEKSRSPVAAVLRQAASGWRLPQVARWLVDELAQGRADGSEIAALIVQRELVIATAGDRLRELRGGRGISRGVAVALSGSQDEIGDVLKGEDVEAARGLLAAALLADVTLPATQVGPLLQSPDARLQDTAERFLYSADPREARRLLRAAHPGEFLVSGFRSYSDPGHVSFSQLGEREQALAREVRAPDGPDKIYALLYRYGGFGKEPPTSIFVRVRGRSAELIMRADPASWLRRPLSEDELQKLERFLSDEKADQLWPFVFNADGRADFDFEFMALDRGGGYRLFKKVYTELPGSVETRLSQLFGQLVRERPLKREFAVTQEGSGAKPPLEAR